MTTKIPFWLLMTVILKGARNILFEKLSMRELSLAIVIFLLIVAKFLMTFHHQ